MSFIRGKNKRLKWDPIGEHYCSSHLRGTSGLSPGTPEVAGVHTKVGVTSFSLFVTFSFFFRFPFFFFFFQFSFFFFFFFFLFFSFCFSFYLYLFLFLFFFFVFFFFLCFTFSFSFLLFHFLFLFLRSAAKIERGLGTERARLGTLKALAQNV